MFFEFYTYTYCFLNCFQARSNLNGLQHSPQQMTQSLSTIQQTKVPLNGMKSNLRYSSQPLGNTILSITNGRKLGNLETPLEKRNDIVEKGMPIFAKPFKIPSQPDHQISKSRIPNLVDHSSSHSDGGKDVESILKMMTSTLEPLTKIAATPRTEIDVQTPNKPFVYALPPLLRAPANDCNKSMLKFYYLSLFYFFNSSPDIGEHSICNIFWRIFHH